LKFSVLALRQAEALQKWKEITQSVDTNYRDQIKAHFGVNVLLIDSVDSFVPNDIPVDC
jgi:hypothetical protein